MEHRLSLVMTAAFGVVLACGTFLVPGHASLSRLSAVASASLIVMFVGMVLIAELKRPRE